MKRSVHLIKPDNFEAEVISEQRPVLLLCMPRDEEFFRQVKVMEDIAARYGGELKVGYLEETFIQSFKKNFNVQGTPTFLILVQGKERGRMLGLADPETLMDFVSQSNGWPLSIHRE